MVALDEAFAEFEQRRRAAYRRLARQLAQRARAELEVPVRSVQMTWGELRRLGQGARDEDLVMLHIGERAGWLARGDYDPGARCVNLHDGSSTQGT